MGVVWLFLRPLLPRLILWGSVALGAGGAFLYFSHKYETQGYNRAISEIASDNQEAVNAANEARNKVTTCYDSGGAWDASRGVCVR